MNAKHISNEALQTLMRAVLDIVRAEKLAPGIFIEEEKIFAELAITLYPRPGQLKKIIKEIIDTSGQEDLRYTELVEIKAKNESEGDQHELEDAQGDAVTKDARGAGSKAGMAQDTKPGLENYAGNKPENKEEASDDF